MGFRAQVVHGQRMMQDYVGIPCDHNHPAIKEICDVLYNIVYGTDELVCGEDQEQAAFECFVK